jgi:pimeloyl-ACP methyl ester carboxylesterase
MPRVDLGDVRTSYDVTGEGEPLVLLHPGAADSRAFAPNVPALAERFRVFTPDRRGHGRTPDVDGPITMDLMAADTAAFIETVVGGPAHVVGCSDGASVGIVAAVRRPEAILRLAVVAGVAHHEGWLPGVVTLDDEAREFLAAWNAEVSPDGPGHFAVLERKLDAMHETDPALTAKDLGGVTSPTLVMLADDDEVRLEHAIAMYRAIPDAQLAVVPGTSHGLMVEKPDLVNRMLLDFLGSG